MHRLVLGIAPLAVLAIVSTPWPARADDFPACIGEIRAQAIAGGITTATFDTAMAGIEPDAEVIEAMDQQPEFMLSIWEYMARLVSDKRIADGKRMLAEWGDVLEDVERAFGVDRHIVLAVWGVESNYGTIMGSRPLVRSLATASCFGRRQSFFRGELVETLRITQKGDIRAGDLKGSWAGAFGHTQFMPSTFQRLAIDFDADGRRDIVGSVPDALASTANFLKKAGWELGKPWGHEVVLPRGYAGPSGRPNRMALSKWDALGIERFGGLPLTGEAPAALLLPAGAHGPAFIVYGNFDALYSYNAAESYALAIGHLADRLRGGRGFRGAWPLDDPALSRSQRIELQEHLARLGYDVAHADGIIGPRTVDAIKSFQKSRGLQPDGYAGVRLLRTLLSAPLS